MLFKGGIETEIVYAGQAIFEDAMHIYLMQRTCSSNAQWDSKLLTAWASPSGLH
jgi:hypothetical protein